MKKKMLNYRTRLRYMREISTNFCIAMHVLANTVRVLICQLRFTSAIEPFDRF